MQDNMQCGSHLPAGDILKYACYLIIASILSVGAYAQQVTQGTITVAPGSRPQIYAVNLTSRTVEAINYGHRRGATDVDLAGTALASLRGCKGEGTKQAWHDGGRGGIQGPRKSNDLWR